jgi:hypothetical protein
MKFQRFTQVALTEDIPQYQLKKGDIGTIVEYYPMPQREEDGYSLEGLLPQDTLEVSESQIELVTALTHA